VASAVTLAAALVTWLAPLNPFFRINVNDKLAWWAVNPYYYWLVWIPMIGVSLYMIIWIVLRQIHMVRGLSKLYAAYDVVAVPFHPDRCNGFAAVGDYSVRTTLIVILGGFWLAFMIIQPVFLGETMRIRADLAFLMSLYILTVPALFTIPVWSTHKVMVNAKSLALESVGKQIRQALKGTKRKNQPTLARIQALRQAFLLVDQEYTTWPFRKLTLGGLGVTAYIPPLVTAATAYLSTAGHVKP